MALGDELAVLTACDDELYVLIGARALCVQCARTRTLLRKSVPRHVVLPNISALPRHVVLRIRRELSALEVSVSTKNRPSRVCA